MKKSDIERIAGSVRYQIVSGDSPHELTNKVNKLAEEGWKPSGSQTMTISLHDFINRHKMTNENK